MNQLPVADRFSAGRTDNPYWDENVWFSVSIPEKRVYGIICSQPRQIKPTI